VLKKQAHKEHEDLRREDHSIGFACEDLVVRGKKLRPGPEQLSGEPAVSRWIIPSWTEATEQNRHMQHRRLERKTPNHRSQLREGRFGAFELCLADIRTHLIELTRRRIQGPLLNGGFICSVAPSSSAAFASTLMQLLVTAALR
jgi:hypothetical protein